MSGQQIDSGQGSVGPARLLNLKSRKSGTGSTTRVLAGVQVSIVPGNLIGGPGAVLSGSLVGVGQGAFGKQSTRGVTGSQVAISQTNIGPNDSGWSITSITFTQGAGVQTAQLPVPSGYQAGGYYQVASGSLAGITLSDSGSLTYDGSAATGSASFTFGYTEPGALPTLTLHVGAGGVNVPYMATVYPAETAVPSGYGLVSPEDQTLRSSTLSSWPDGSAQVMVVAGSVTASFAQVPITLRPSSVVQSPLTLTNLQSCFTNTNAVSCTFDGQTFHLTRASLTNADWTWWANPQVICARYRIPITNKGSMEAVIDIHAFAGGRAFVEVVIENGKVNADAATVAAVASQTYTNATVSVNGTTIATASSPTTNMTAPRYRQRSTTFAYYAGGHEAFRSWYCAAEVSGGVVTPKTANDHHALFGIEVTHDTTYLRSMPWGFQPAVESGQTMSTKYERTYDRYEPWGTGRLRVPGMSSASDDEQYAPMTEEQSDYVITGSLYARRAIIATGLSCHSMNFAWRHTTGRLPTRTQMAGKTTTNGAGNGKWPETHVVTGPCWGGESSPQGSHIPFIGVMPFLCRPSPCFIEIAQKEFCWHATNYASPDAATHPFDQPRARAHRLRNYAGAIFLTPDADYDGTGRKDSIRAALMATIAVNNAFLDQAWNTLKFFYGADKDNPSSSGGGNWFMHGFIVLNWTMLERAKVLRGADQTAWGAMLDKIADIHVRFINDATQGEWRAIPYYQYLGTVNGSTMDMGSGNFALQNRAKYGVLPAGLQSERGYWYLSTDTTWPATTYNDFFPYDRRPGWPQANDTAGSSGDYYYDATFFASICHAVERGVTGADAAWSRIVGTSTRSAPNDATAGITNFTQWISGFTTYPRYNRWPRNKA